MIYFIQSGQAGPIKIGYTKNESLLKRRLNALQTACPDKLYLRGLFEGTLGDEYYLHNKFRYLRIRGEWFRPNKTLLSHITEIYYKYLRSKQLSFENLPDNIKDALRKVDGNRTKAARILKVSRSTLYRMLRGVC